MTARPPLWLALALLLALAALWAFWDTRERIRAARNQDIGATIQREGDLRETWKRVEQAHEAREELRDPDGRARYDQCLRTARTPAHCQRFLPGVPADQR